jgi:hypothetical protein
MSSGATSPRPGTAAGTKTPTGCPRLLCSRLWCAHNGAKSHCASRHSTTASSGQRAHDDPDPGNGDGDGDDDDKPLR